MELKKDADFMGYDPLLLAIIRVPQSLRGQNPYLQTAFVRGVTRGNGSAMRTIRLLHRYLGLFFAPAILFFSFSGALQTFGWHETPRNRSYEPPAWIVRMAQLHKKQTLSVPVPKTKAPKSPISDPPTDAVKKDTGDVKMKLVLKCFVFVMSIGLMLSTVLGVIMALRYGKDARLIWALVLVGFLFPVAVALM